MAWTDERMDDLASGMDGGFARVGDDIRELRVEVRNVRDEIGATRVELGGQIGATRVELGGQIGATRAELGGQIGTTRIELGGQIGTTRAELKTEIDALRTLIIRIGITMIAGLLGVIATLVGAIATGALAG